MSDSRALRDDEDGGSDPDEVIVPESRPHRRASALIAAAAARCLGAGREVDANLNWYPSDAGPPIAPDVMVLPPGVLDRAARSFRQPADGPGPEAVVEVPSTSDEHLRFLEKLRRYQRLGTIVYIVVTAPAALDVTRLAPGDDEPSRWLGRACPELGGLFFQVHDDRIAVRTPDGLVATDVEELLAGLDKRADAAHAQAEAASSEAARLAELLRRHGLDPAAET